jgi:hypothetical protein
MVEVMKTGNAYRLSLLVCVPSDGPDDRGPSDGLLRSMVEDRLENGGELPFLSTWKPGCWFQLELAPKSARGSLKRGGSIFDARPLHVVVFALFWLALGCAACTCMKALAS